MAPRSALPRHSQGDSPTQTLQGAAVSDGELPDGWAWACLRAVCSKVQDGTHFSPKEQSREGSYRYITAKNIKEWGIDLSDVTFIREDVHREIYSRCNPEKGDVLY